MKRFYSAFVVTVIGLFLAGLVGWFSQIGANGFIGALNSIVLCSALGLLEVSLSFDNALINATIIRRMNDVWRHRFLTWGMLIAVVGMRVVLPLAIVGVVAWINPWSAFVMALKEPKLYAEIMQSAHIPIVGFGGMFLLMVSLNHFFDPEKTTHWLGIIESPAARLGHFRFIETLIGAAVLASMCLTLKQQHPQEVVSLLVAGSIGILLQASLSSLNSRLETDNSSRMNLATKGASAALFFYLEVQDASFSLDGVIGAFAITNNLFIIAIGLGIGAMFVRSLTLLLVDQGTLSQYRYIETGAFYAMGALAATMLLDIFYQIPEIVPGGLSALLIVLSFVSSIRYNNKQGI